MQQNQSNRGIRILLTEGSSLSARQTVGALGPLCYTIEICDPDRLCISRFSRFVRAVYQSPASGRDPLAYLRFVETLLARKSFDVLLPTHEQAFLIARFQTRLAKLSQFAVAPFASFMRIQGKADFAATLAEIGLPRPETEIACTSVDLRRPRVFPYYIKSNYGTAGTGVWRIENAESLAHVVDRLERTGQIDGRQRFVIQAVAPGVLCQAQAVFEHGALRAAHCAYTRAPGMGGGFAARVGVSHPCVHEHLEILGRHLQWHGPLALDYLYNTASERPAHIEANPRLVEPMNGVYSGVNLAELTVRLSLGESLSLATNRRAGVRSHSYIPLVLARAESTGSRRAVARETFRAIGHRGTYARSCEDLTPLRRDPRSAIPVAIVLARLLLRPKSATRIATGAVGAYSLSAAAMQTVLQAQ